MKITKGLKRTIESELLGSYALSTTRSSYLHEHHLKMFASPFIEGDRFELPSFLHSTDIYKDLIDDTRSIVPIGKNNANSSYKTVDSILNRILNFKGSVDLGILGVTSDKYGTWYGCKGLLLDKDFNVVLMSVIEGTVQSDRCHMNNVKLYVNPKISISEQGVEKTVYTKIVPYCLNYDCWQSMFYTSTFAVNNIPSWTKPNIVFKDVKDMFFITPNIPTSINIDEDINKILEESKEEITEYLG